MSDNEDQHAEMAESNGEITVDMLIELLNNAFTETYSASCKDPLVLKVQERVEKIFKKDYEIIKINNENEELTSHYPSKILVPTNEAPCPDPGTCHKKCQPRSPDSSNEIILEEVPLRRLILRAKIARCRQRFPIPVILYNGRYVCRSATISSGYEIYLRKGIDFVSSFTSSNPPELPEVIMNTPRVERESKEIDSMMDPYSTTGEENPAFASFDNENQGDWPVYDEVRREDIRLLNYLGVGTIIDLMVEKKKVKYGLYVSSSEKIDALNRYHNFQVYAFPYPGCEFFAEFTGQSFNTENLVFDWNNPQCDVELNVPPLPILPQVKINWENYKNWDLAVLTQNYIKYIVKMFHDSNSGMLIHCISGWDRTPLFISLVRLSLWADGVIHKHLTVNEMLYLTIAYDWHLFGHQLVSRTNKSEEIFFFCFYMLKYLVGDEFSVNPCKKLRSDVIPEEDLGDDFNDNEPANFSDESNGKKVWSEVKPEEADIDEFNDNEPASLSDESNGKKVWSDVKPEEADIDEFNDNEPANLSDGSNGNLPSMHPSLSGTRTSPIAVPRAGTRKRSDSASSSGWGKVSSTGSMKGSDSSDPSSGCSADDPNCSRARNLTRLRQAFYDAFYKSEGKKIIQYNEGPKGFVNSILSSFNM